MNSSEHLQLLAHYNRIANERLYAKCAALTDAEYRQARRGSFGSIHGLLNHMLLGDQIWISRFNGNGSTTPALNSILFDNFEDLRSARMEQDAGIEAFFEKVDDAFMGGTFSYINNKGKHYLETAPIAVLHFFNHQTHHRGQVHLMLSQTDVEPPSLDLHRILNP